MRFALKAVNSENVVVAVAFDAPNEAALRDLAKERGLAILSVKRQGLAWTRPGRFPTALFSIELLALLEAGLNVVEAIQTLAEKEGLGETRRVLAELLAALENGLSLSQAVSRFPEAFSALYVATIKSSEQTGNLREALSRYIAYQEEFERVRKKIFASLLYPAILSVVGAAVFAFLLLYVVPRFARVYQDISTELPLFSSLLLTVGQWIDRYRLSIGIAAVVFAVAATYAISRTGIRAALVAQLWKVPTLGERARIYQLSRLYRTSGMLLRAGIPAAVALGMVVDLLPSALRGALRRAVTLVEEGSAMSMALTATGLTSPVATRMLLVGERSGRMGDLMDRIAQFYDEETSRFMDAYMRVFEPVLMALIGIGVGAVVVLMYMPIFELAGSIR